MALRFSLPLRFQFHPFPSITHFTKRPKHQIICTKKRFSDAELASKLATEVAKLNTNLLQRDEAMKKSKALLFSEICQYLDLNSDETKKKWKKMDDEEKWVLVKEFVSGWSDNFHPLSSKSVREMVDEYLQEENSPSISPASMFLPGLRRLMGFSQNK